MRKIKVVDAPMITGVPSREEILQEMELHNNDEVGIDNQWSYEDTEYHLMLSDKYYYGSQSSAQAEEETPVDQFAPIQTCKVWPMEEVVPNEYGKCTKCKSSLDKHGECTGDEYSTWLAVNGK